MVPGGGAGRGLEQFRGIGSAVHWDSVREFMLPGGGAPPQGRQDGAGAEGRAVRSQAPAEGAGRRSRISVVKRALSVLGNLVARDLLLS